MTSEDGASLRYYQEKAGLAARFLWPKHEVVLMAVRKAVSAATRTFTANSMIRCFFIRFSFFSVVRWRGGQPPPRLKARDYSVAG